MPDTNPLIEFVKALARRQARLDAQAPSPANQNNTTPPEKTTSTK
ncbi:hypothetical protein BSY16_3976 [Sinorhizobium sp. RAC02]|nr:hypothetical protein BSY16_3976 [Sinorhizobium sp. RAC02]